MLGTYKVRTSCLNDVNDKRERNWEDEVVLFLDGNYKDWRNPSGTFMVPCEFTYKRNEANAGEEAEKQFYDLLQQFGESHSEPMFVIHSYEYTEVVSASELNEESKDEDWTVEESTEKKRRFWLMGEHDFVVIHHNWGIIFFQVKASSKLQKRYNEGLQQIKKDKRSIWQYGFENFSTQMRKALNSMLNKGKGFVVMPNCSGEQVGKQSKGKPSNGVFKEDCENVDAFSNWWSTRVAEVGWNIDQDLFEALVMYYVGTAHSLPCTLSGSIEEDGEHLEICTKEQLKVLLSLKSEQWISGPAGSGKTWLLIKKVLKLAQKALKENTGEKILVVCYNRPLSVMLSKTFEDNLNGNTQEVVRVKTFESLLYELTGFKPGNSDKEKESRIASCVQRLKNGTRSFLRYDHIFVDEGQDLCGKKWPTLFELLCKGYDEGTPGIMWFFFDTNQYLGISSQHPLQSRETLLLDKVFRNTQMVFDQSKKYFSSGESITLGHHVHGLEITWDDSLTSGVHNGASCIKKHVDKLRQNKVPVRDICIITQNVQIRDGMKAELEENGVDSQNAEELFKECEDKVVVESIWRFKGLESKVVILYDPPYYHIEGMTTKNVKELLYTALSRCFCYLIVITTQDGCNVLQSQEGMKEYALEELMESDDVEHMETDDD